MKPLQHALIAAHRYGGEWQDWYAFHDWFDQSKMVFPSMQHRMFLHSDFGCHLAVRVFGEFLTAKDGSRVATRELSQDHQIEDLGRVIPLAEWLAELDALRLDQAKAQALRHQPQSEQVLATDPLSGLVQRYGGCETDYAPIVAFFDEPAQYARDDSRSQWILHNSFGIYLAEEVFGKVLTQDNGRLISVRSLGETLVKARLGFIPSAAVVASRVRLRSWMVGTEVGEGLRSRKEAEANEGEMAVLPV